MQISYMENDFKLTYNNYEAVFAKFNMVACVWKIKPYGSHILKQGTQTDCSPLLDHYGSTPRGSDNEQHLEVRFLTNQ